jgi:hypothetical protein
VALPLTPDTIAAAYEYLRSLPPCLRWNLPEPEDVVFKVSYRTGEFGRYQKVGDKHVISMSIVAIGHTETLMRYLAHEMIHLHLEITGMESRNGNPNTHNAAFRKFADRVCKIHGFDPKAFY